MIKQYAEEKVLEFDKYLDAYTQGGSGWIFDKIGIIETNIFYTLAAAVVGSVVFLLVIGLIRRN